MHRKLIRGGLLPLLLLAAWAAAPAQPARAGGLDGLKIGVVDVNRALNQSAAGERSKGILLASKSQLESELKSKEDALKQQRDELQNNIMLTKSARQAREKELADQENQLRQDVQDAQRQLQDKERKLTQSIYVDLRRVIGQIAKEGHYDLVLEQGAANVILYSSAKFDDLTDQVIARYNLSKAGDGGGDQGGTAPSTGKNGKKPKPKP